MLQQNYSWARNIIGMLKILVISTVPRVRLSKLERQPNCLFETKGNLSTASSSSPDTSIRCAIRCQYPRRRLLRSPMLLRGGLRCLRRADLRVPTVTQPRPPMNCGARNRHLRPVLELETQRTYERSGGASLGLIWKARWPEELELSILVNNPEPDLVLKYLLYFIIYKSAAKCHFTYK